MTEQRARAIIEELDLLMIRKKRLHAIAMESSKGTLRIGSLDCEVTLNDAEATEFGDMVVGWENATFLKIQKLREELGG